MVERFRRGGQEPGRFAQSCYDLVKNSKWAGVFDGIDIDWEYPNACGNTCDTSGREAFKNLMAALRSKFGSGAPVTAAITADATSGGKIDAANYAGAAQYVDWYNPMTYDYFGAWDARRRPPPLAAELLRGNPEGELLHLGNHREAHRTRHPGVETAARHRLLRPRLDRGHPGRTGRHRHGPGGGHLRAGDRRLQGAQDQVPRDRHRRRHRLRKCGSNWWSYDTPSTIATKMAYKNQQGLGGSFLWELSGDTASGELIKAIN